MREEIRLSRYSHGAGCACKLGSAELAQVLRRIAPVSDPALLVGHGTADDAAVYRLRDDLALIVTVDFFAPIVDDARTYGRIAATNALSDVYAMGGDPLLALNIVGWPRDELPMELLGEVLAGGDEVVREAGAVTAGGHSVDDREPKYGLAVAGAVTPNEIWTNAGARIGDVLVLTKPIGTGVVVTAAKQERCPAEVLAAAVATMDTSNRDAMRAARAAGGVHAATDITGFGLLGHLAELCAASGVSAVIDADAVPFIDGAAALASAGAIAGGSRRNRDAIEPVVDRGSVDEASFWLLCDAQTSGGLLIAIDPVHAERLVASVPGARIIGAIDAPARSVIRVR